MLPIWEIYTETECRLNLQLEKACELLHKLYISPLVLGPRSLPIWDEVDDFIMENNW
jgi:hypothetical protein